MILLKTPGCDLVPLGNISAFSLVIERKKAKLHDIQYTSLKDK